MIHCIECEQETTWVWTDTYGVAECLVCGTTSRLYEAASNEPETGEAGSQMPRWLLPSAKVAA